MFKCNFFDNPEKILAVYAALVLEIYIYIVFQVIEIIFVVSNYIIKTVSVTLISPDIYPSWEKH